MRTASMTSILKRCALFLLVVLIAACGGGGGGDRAPGVEPGPTPPGGPVPPEPNPTPPDPG